MNYGLYLSASGVLTNMHRQDVAAANLANVSTTGFKRSLSALMARPAESKSVADLDLHQATLDKLGGGVFVAPTKIDSNPGELEPTGNAFDLAIEGPGYFAVRTSEGGREVTRLTRDGRLTVSPDGFLTTTAGGAKLLGTNGQPIAVDLEQTMHVDQRGNVKQGDTTVGTLMLTDVPADRMRHYGHGLFDAPAEVIDKADQATGLVRQAHLERSNVDSIKEMLALMSATRAISGSANLIRYHDSVMDRAVNVLGRVA